MIKVSFEFLRIHWLGWVLAVVFLVLRTQEISAQGEEWIARYNGPGYSGDEAYDLAVDDSGNVYVTGMGRGGFGIYSDFITIKYNSMGDTLWVRIYNGLGNEGDVAYSLAVDDSGNVYVTGYSWGIGTRYDYATVKYNSMGDTVWVRRYNGPVNSDDLAMALAVDGSGNVYVTGYSAGGGFQYDYATIKYNSMGDTLWVRRYFGPGNDDDYAQALAVDNSVNVYVTGYSDGDITTIKYNPLGDTLWVRRYNGAGYALEVDGSGNVYVAGYSGGDFATIKYNTMGDTVWVRKYNGPESGGDYARSLAVDESGNVYVTGRSGSSTVSDYATVKYNSMGDTLWARRYDEQGIVGDIAQDLAVDVSGNVYVTGYSDGGVTGADFTTIKYNSMGDAVWVRRYNQTGNSPDGAYAIAVDSSGNVYVTGSSWVSGPEHDYITIKYCRQDVATFSLPLPPDTVFKDSSYTPQAWVRNFGSCGGNFNVIASINGYGDTQHVTNLDPADSTLVSFSLWEVPSPDSGCYTMTVCVDSPYDEDATNNCSSKPICVYMVGVEEEGNDQFKLQKFELYQNHPNPFHSITSIQYQIPVTPSSSPPFEGGVRGGKVPVRLEIYGITGRLVETLVISPQDPGVYRVVWDGRDQSSGIYFYRIHTPHFTATKRLTFLR